MLFLMQAVIQEQTPEPMQFDVICELCQIVVQGVESYVSDPTNVEAVKEFLDQACELVSAFDYYQWCEQLIGKFYDQLVQYIVAGYGPQQACTMMGAC
ncbi:Saposin-like_type B domin-containing protein [Hexamita inflata]|uniref:Saposin-like type B domin-containing protein n=1 Tax=Hexamita inflata TaxID=28002 RepID=A0AA86Q8Q1_9EUKA|nr:Saposin-like type B domin-containing protein [Hexamita inflata]CAI9947840.1 Saposin-like type B domin-containing protein [Hexamita inflata]